MLLLLLMLGAVDAFSLVLVLIIHFFTFTLCFGQKRHLNMISTRAWLTDGRMDRHTLLKRCHCGPEQRKTLNKKPSNHSLSHEWGSERSERASQQVSAAEPASEASSAERFFIFQKNCVTDIRTNGHQTDNNKSDRVQTSDAFWRSASVLVSELSF